MARRNRILGLACATAGLVLATSMMAGGCGGSESGGGETVDTGTDTGVAADTAKDTAPADTKPEVAPDTGPVSNYDAPGSLFDAVIPDVVFDGDVTAAGSYDCTLAHCHDQVAACDKDERCRGFLLCVLVDCKASFTDTTCLFGCAGEYDVTGLSDPIVGEVRDILTCSGGACASECPAVPLDGGFDATPPPDGATDDAGAGEASSGEVGPGEAGTAYHPSGWHAPSGSKAIDPKLVDFMCEVQTTFASMPLVRDGLVDHMQSISAASK